MVRSAPPEKLSLPEVMTAPLIAGVGDDLVDDLLEFVHHLFGEDVHRTVRHVPGDQRDAVGVGFDGEVGVGHGWLFSFFDATFSRPRISAETEFAC